MLLDPLPLSQTVTPSRTPSPLERDVLYGRHISPYFLFLQNLLWDARGRPLLPTPFLKNTLSLDAPQAGCPGTSHPTTPAHPSARHCLRTFRLWRIKLLMNLIWGHCINTSRRKWPFLTHLPTLSRYTHPPTPFSMTYLLFMIWVGLWVFYGHFKNVHFECYSKF